MNPAFNAYLAHELVTDHLREAERFRRTKYERPHEQPQADRPYTSVTVRRSRPGDTCAIRRLAELEGRRPPAEPLLVVEVDGVVLAARSLQSRQTISDPFRPTAQLVELLDLRSLHLRDAAEQVGPRGRRRRVHRLVRALSATTR